MNKFYGLKQDFSQMCEKFYWYLSIVSEIEQDGEDPKVIKDLAKDYLKRVIIPKEKELEERMLEKLPKVTATRLINKLQMEVIQMEKGIE